MLDIFRRQGERRSISICNLSCISNCNRQPLTSCFVKVLYEDFNYELPLRLGLSFQSVRINLHVPLSAW